MQGEAFNLAGYLCKIKMPGKIINSFPLQMVLLIASKLSGREHICLIIWKCNVYLSILI
jgi:hypothetical protein